MSGHKRFIFDYNAYVRIHFFNPINGILTDNPSAIAQVSIIMLISKDYIVPLLRIVLDAPIPP